MSEYNDYINQLKRSILSVMVLDLGYRSAPVFGEKPIRHVCLWDLATDGMSRSDLNAEIDSMVQDQESQAAFIQFQRPKE